MNKDILICGVGGQGTVLASRVLAAAAMAEGSPVHSAETIGMAQRGGSVTSHVRIGDRAFEPGEAVRNLRYLRPEGIAVVNTAASRPVTESLKPSGYDGEAMTVYLSGKCSCVFVDGEEACRPFGSARFLNVILLGVAAGSGHLGLKEETLLKQLEIYVPARFLEVNLQAFKAGLEIGKNSK